MPVIETNWMRLIGEHLRGESEDLTHDDLPRRWVDLIHYLDKQERMCGAQRAEDRPLQPCPLGQDTVGTSGSTTRSAAA